MWMLHVSLGTLGTLGTPWRRSSREKKKKGWHQKRHKKRHATNGWIMAPCHGDILTQCPCLARPAAWQPLGYRLATPSRRRVSSPPVLLSSRRLSHPLAPRILQWSFTASLFAFCATEAPQERNASILSLAVASPNRPLSSVAS
jgi:hypothetical protein